MTGRAYRLWKLVIIVLKDSLLEVPAQSGVTPEKLAIVDFLS